MFFKIDTLVKETIHNIELNEEGEVKVCERNVKISSEALAMIKELERKIKNNIHEEYKKLTDFN